MEIHSEGMSQFTMDFVPPTEAELAELAPDILDVPSQDTSGLDADPIIYLGLDIAVKRDTCALVGVIPLNGYSNFAVHGHCVWKPPVNLSQDVAPVVDTLLRSNRVAALYYDPYQAATLVQQFAADGYGPKLVEVNQGAPMIGAANTLHALLTENRLSIYDDPELEAYFSWAVAKNTERGWRIVKKNQSKPIDFVISLAMALQGATLEAGYEAHPSWDSTTHVRSAFALP